MLKEKIKEEKEGGREGEKEGRRERGREEGRKASLARLPELEVGGGASSLSRSILCVNFIGLGLRASVEQICK